MNPIKNSPGKDVLSFCGVCKMIMNHVIVNMKAPDQIGHCECLTCHARHPFRDPHGLKKTSATKPPRTKAPSVPVEQVWASAINHATGETKPYSLSTSYAESDIVLHPKFGKGIVQKRLEDSKIQVLFESDLKILMHKG